MKILVRVLRKFFRDSPAPLFDISCCARLTMSLIMSNAPSVSSRPLSKSRILVNFSSMSSKRYVGSCSSEPSDWLSIKSSGSICASLDRLDVLLDTRDVLE